MKQLVDLSRVDKQDAADKAKAIQSDKQSNIFDHPQAKLGHRKDGKPPASPATGRADSLFMVMRDRAWAC